MKYFSRYLFLTIFGVLLIGALTLSRGQTPSQTIPPKVIEATITNPQRLESPLSQLPYGQGPEINVNTTRGSITLTSSEITALIRANTTIESTFEYFYEVSVSPTGRYLAMALHGPAWDVVLTHDIRTKQILVISHGSLGYSSLSWSPDEHFLAYISGADITLLGVFDIRTKKQLALNDSDKLLRVRSFEWSSDSERLSYVTTEKGHLVLDLQRRRIYEAK